MLGRGVSVSMRDVLSLCQLLLEEVCGCSYLLGTATVSEGFDGGFRR